MIRKMMMMQFAVAGLALAQAPAQLPNLALEKAPVVGAGYKLACPAGTRQIGGPKTDFGAYACMKSTADGMRIMHGPMISFDNAGHVVAIGTMEESYRTGTWKFFDAAGNLLGVTSFLKGEYNGVRVEYQADGKLKFEENWLNGQRQGPQKTFDGSGVATITEYRNDRPVAK
jgi:hypothetical protein